MIYRFQPQEMKVESLFGFKYRWGVKEVREGKSKGLVAWSNRLPTEEDWMELEKDLENESDK